MIDVRVDFLSAAGEEVDRRARETAPLIPPLTRSRVEAALGQPVTAFRAVLENRNSRIYRLRSKAGEELVAKQLYQRSEEDCLTEYEHLVSLSVLSGRESRMPRALALLKDEHSYLMEAAAGNSIGSLTRGHASVEELGRAAAAAGRVLAAVHRAWSGGLAHVPVVDLEADLTRYPSRAVAGARSVIRSALARLKNESCLVGQPYLDFDPLNVFWDGAAIGLIDPPERHLCGPLEWDCSVFRVGLRRACWRSPRRLLRGTSAVSTADRLVRAFDSGYAVAGESALPPPRGRRLLGLILELQRIGQLISWQAVRPAPGFLSTLGSMAARPLTLQALRIEERRVLNAIAASLA